MKRSAASDRNSSLCERIGHASTALETVGDLNRMLAVPSGFHEVVKGVRRPLHEHFGTGLFPIVADFDTGFGVVTIQRLAKALIDRDEVEANLGYYYNFAPVRLQGLSGSRDRSGHDPRLVHDTLIRFMLYDYACLVNFRMPYKRLLAEVGKGTPGALLKLVRVDKSFLVGSYGASLVILKQHEADWEFFAKLGEAVKQRPLDELEYLFKAKLICAYLWESDMAGESYRTMVRALEDTGVLGRGAVDPRSFAKLLNRAGLKRRRYNKKARP